MITLSDILISLVPNARFAIRGNETYENITWMSDPSLKPTQEQIQLEKERLIRNEAEIYLKIERNFRLEESDWVVLRCYEKEVPVPQEWKDYRDALRCITDNHTATFDEIGHLTGVTWPKRPKYITFDYLKINEEEKIKLEDGSNLLLETSIRFITHFLPKNKKIVQPVTGKYRVRTGTKYEQ